MAQITLCAIPDCGKNAYEKGWCTKHHKRWTRYGDPLKTLKIPHGEAQRFYSNVVLNHSADECLFWPYAKAPRGYGVLGSKRTNVLVCEEFNGPRPSPSHQAAHSCGNASCVAPQHLSWKTPVENNADKIAHGTILRGEKMDNAILTESQVREIRSLRHKVSTQILAARFGVKRATINNVMRRTTWGWLPD